MPIVNMKDMLQHAYQNGYAIGAFDLINLDFLRGIMDAAEQAQSPVILSLAESHFQYFDFDIVMPAVEAAAARASVPVAIHLDHGNKVESAVHAIRMGCNGVMVDASHNDLVNNVVTTKAVVETAHSCGVPVEGELGYVPGVEGEDAELHPGEIAYTTVEEAREYVARTRVDFLAVSIGTVHGRMKGEPKLDYQRLNEINDALRIPLVIHGGTGLSDKQFAELISRGVSKINYYTALADTAARQIKNNASSTENISYTGLVKDTCHAISEETLHCMELWGCAGRADELLSLCRPWKPVEHLIIYNVDGLDSERAIMMIAEGKRVLSAIPGVRRVFTGEAIQKNSLYTYTWLVRFCHPVVIDSYREHPYHVAFADNLFRPVAGERISIDYLAMQH